MPLGTLLTAVEALDSQLYIMGGLHNPAGATTEMYAFNLKTNTILPRQPLPKPLAASGTVVWEDKIYLFGGGSASQGTASNSVYVYDPELNTWTSLADMPHARAYPVAEIVNGKMYVIGGASTGSTFSYNYVECYDPLTNTWAAKNPMPTARAYMTSAVLNNKIYVFGGLGGTPPYISLATVEIYDPTTDTWTTAPELSTSRWGALAGTLDNIIFLAGGANEFSVDLDIVDGLQGENGSWLSYGPMPYAAHGLGGTVFENNLYLVGGLSEGTVRNDILVYHPSVGVSETPEATQWLSQNYPNPFHNVTTIDYEVSHAGAVSIILYDVTGKVVQTLVQDKQPAGKYSCSINAGSLQNGVYTYTLRIDNQMLASRLLIVNK
ncbi:MAG: T9SS type A sorting domain-containing protein [Lewinellaceae bacterium]|nr:T9SS type A sorting domain-containing protein [Lewinellaceae bacterium]